MNTEIRQPAVAGSFYPEDPTELAKMIAQILATTKREPVSGQILGLIAPHAGYIYSGHVAAAAYKTIQGLEFDDVIVISPCHVATFDGASIYNGDAYMTPLGEIPVDKELSARIAASSDIVKLSAEGHRITYRGGEHSLEVQLPFLQTMLGSFKLVAVVMGSQSFQICRALAERIAAACQDAGRVLIVASSDLSHFHDYKTASSLDSAVIDLISRFDYAELSKKLDKGRVEACGGGPIIATLLACELLGANSAKVVKYANSGDVTGDSSSVVGYLSAVISKEQKGSRLYEMEEEAEEVSSDEGPGVRDNPASAVDIGLTSSDKRILLQLARDAIAAAFDKRQLMLDSLQYSDVLAEHWGAFVTLTIDGRLRGCIGFIKGFKPLYQVISEMAVQAAFHDPRFPPLTRKEFEITDIEISVLTPMTVVLDPQEIVVGRDGLYIERDYYHGILLPQVPVENGWDRDTFLEQTCLKAGLMPGSWKLSGTQIYKFQADIFGGEHKFK